LNDTFPATCTNPIISCVNQSGGGSCINAGPPVTASLPVGATVTVTLQCLIATDATGTLTNTATISSSVTDPNPANDSAADSDTLIQPNLVSGTMTIGGSNSVGGTIIYRVVLINSGGGTQLDNPGDEFIDVLPPQVALLSAAATSGVATAQMTAALAAAELTLADPVTNTVTWNGSLLTGGQVTITINARVLASASGIVVTNQGTIAYDADNNGSNESTALTDDPSLVGSADPSSFRGAPRAPGAPFSPIAPIPTLSLLSLPLLSLLMVGLVVGWFRRRR